MQIFVGFLPFIAFAILERFAPVTMALAAAALIAATACWRDRQRGEPLKSLDLGALVIFLLLAVLTAVGIGGLSTAMVRLCVDLGLVAVAGLSLVRRAPFTLAYTPGQAPDEPLRRALYFRTHSIITAVWTGAFVVCAVADALMAWAPAVPLWAGITATVAALAGAVTFTRRYPERVRARFRASQEPGQTGVSS